mmetsp:Transcript_87358/g.271385  ORF Transcript_87358/g.271385 Transcript_87358/m.271385 type:complete len:211 (-) Transcript_87358:569-1201(-)
MVMTSHAKHLLYVALTPTDVGKRTINVVHVFPEVFVVCSVLIFAPPVVKSLYLATDPLVAYWFGVHPKVIVALPLAFIGASYALHARRRAPRRGAIALSLLGSSAVLAVQANNIAVNAMTLSNTFAASDCEPFTRKHRLEHSWDAAYEFKKACTSKIGEDGLTRFLLRVRNEKCSPTTAREPCACGKLQWPQHPPRRLRKHSHTQTSQKH